jgi:MFS family permease
MGRLGAAVRAAVGASLEALANPGVRRVQGAWLLGFAADTALLVVMMVTVFQAAGPVGVALIGAARMLPSTVSGFLAAAPLARFGPGRLLVALATARGLAALAVVAVLVADADDAWLYAATAAIGAADAMVRAAQHTVLPALARTPSELVTSNVASSTGEALGSFAGPLIAGACLAFGAPAAAAVFAVGAQVIGVAALSGVRFEHAADERGTVNRTTSSRFGVSAGVAALRRQPAIGIIIVGFALQTFVRGLLATLIVVLSTELIGLGDPGVGFLTAAIGVGGVAGLIGGLAIRRSTPLAYAVALAVWGLPIAVIGLAPSVAVAVAALVVVGLSNAILDIIGFTLLQRGCRNEERGPVFAIFEGAVGIGATIGALAAPSLIQFAGLRPALVTTGLVLPIAAVLLGVLLMRMRSIELVPEAAINRLHSVPAFRVLPMTGLERLVLSAVPVAFPAGAVLMRKDEPGDRFYVIESGEVRITDGDRVLNTLGEGAGIGDIALLRGSPRTATVTALTDISASSFDASDFLAAVSGPAAAAAATRVVEERLARSAAES